MEYTMIETGIWSLLPPLTAIVLALICSPISDTTILASTGASCKHIRHVETQLPYAALVAAVCARFAIWRSGVRSPYGPPKQYQTNTYFFKGGFAVKVIL